MSSPHIAAPASVAGIMLRVLAALLPAIAACVWWFGAAVLVQLALASAAALATEALMLRLRGVPVRPFLLDFSALLTAWLLALCLPPLAPWWLTVTATAFAIAVSKQLYGGIGSNLFNPAMVGYAVAIVSFPAQMARWPAPAGLAEQPLAFADALHIVLRGAPPPGLALDAVTLATPLDTLKTQLHLGQAMAQIQAMPVFGNVGGVGGEVVALAFLAGGAYLLAARVVSWHLPLSYLAGVGLLAAALHLADPGHYASPWFHLAAGGTMIGAFFIVTDPVTGPTTPRGKLVFGALAGVLTYLIRVFGGYPDGVAFAVLLMNSAVPLIEAWTQPRVFGKPR